MWLVALTREIEPLTFLTETEQTESPDKSRSELVEFKIDGLLLSEAQTDARSELLPEVTSTDSEMNSKLLSVSCDTVLLPLRY